MLQCVLQGPIRALGIQKTASYFAIGSYYIFGLPLAVLFGIVMQYGLIGLQAGISIAILLQAIANAFIILWSDWQKIADVVE